MEATSRILNRKVIIDDTWINNDENIKSTTKIIISNNGKNVQVFEKGRLKDCDWGTKNLIPESNSTNVYWAIFDNNIAKSTFIFTINKNKMEVRYERDYKLSTKEPKIFVENFTRLNLYKQEPIVITGTETPSTIEFEGTPLQEPNNTPILLLDNLVANHDLEYSHGTTNISNGEYVIKKLSRFILSKVRNTISIRRLMSLRGITNLAQ